MIDVVGTGLGRPIGIDRPVVVRNGRTAVEEFGQFKLCEHYAIRIRFQQDTLRRQFAANDSALIESVQTGSNLQRDLNGLATIYGSLTHTFAERYAIEPFINYPPAVLLWRFAGGDVGDDVRMATDL